MLGTFLASLETRSSTDAGESTAFAVLRPGQARWAAGVSQHAVNAIVALSDGDRAIWLAPRVRQAVEYTIADLLIALGAPEKTPISRPIRPTTVLNKPERQLISALAGEDVPFHRIIVGQRLLQRTCVSEMLDQAEHHLPANERTALFRRLTESVAEFFDATVDAVVAQYQSDRELLVTRRMTARRTLVDQILSGEAIDEDDARRSLGVDLQAHHLALVAFSSAGTTESSGIGDLSDLESTARRAAEALHARSHLAVPDENGLWIWLNRPESFTDADVETVRTGRIAIGRVRIAVGEPGRGVAGFRRSNLAARDAVRVARISNATGARSSVVVHRDVGLTALLLGDPERAKWFVQEELGGLSGIDAATVDLRRTVLSYLDSGSSLVATATALHIHRNTVVYRLRRAEELLGRPLAKGTLALHSALRLDDALN